MGLFDQAASLALGIEIGYEEASLARAEQNERMQREITASYERGVTATKQACREAFIEEFGADAGFTSRLSAIIDAVVVVESESGATHG